MNSLLFKIKDWIISQESLDGALLIGSYSRGEMNTNSDLDIQLFTSNIDFYFDNQPTGALARLLKSADDAPK